MQYSVLSALMVAAASTVTLVAAQNPITQPASAYVTIPAGQPYTIQWNVSFINKMSFEEKKKSLANSLLAHNQRSRDH
jgi:hypothetical protein